MRFALGPATRDIWMNVVTSSIMPRRPKLSTYKTLDSLFGDGALPFLVAHGVPTCLIETLLRAKTEFVLEQALKSAIE